MGVNENRFNKITGHRKNKQKGEQQKL